MANGAVLGRVAAAEPVGGLSQVERTVDTFLSPSKTFRDILRSANWTLPFLLLVLVTLAGAFAVDKKVGYDRVAETQMQQNPKQQDAINQLAPEQRAQAIRRTVATYRISSYAAPVLILVFSAIIALILWGSFNFGLGATTKFGQVLAVYLYASLPKLLLGLLAIATVCFGNNQENYDLKNPVGTNIGFYLPEAATWLKTLLSWFDVIGLWSLALLVLGMAIVAKKTISQSAVVVVGLWLVGLVITVGLAAAFS